MELPADQSEPKYYDSLASMLARYKRTARSAAFKGTTSAEWLKWQDGTRSMLTHMLGIDKLERCPLNPRITQAVHLDQDAVTRQKLFIQVESDVWMPCYILIPDRPKLGRDGKPLCYICPAGHSGGGKLSVAGVADRPVIRDAIDHFNYDYGLQLARLGFVTLCPDPRGFGERRDRALQRDDDESLMQCTCFHLAHMAEPLGLTVVGLLVWDLMRLVDYVVDRDEWDTGGIGCLGFSGGGMQTLWLSALDDRIAKAFISGYMYGVRDSLLILNGNCSCNYVPGLWTRLDMGDIGSLIAPRPVVIQTCVSDHLNGPRGAINADEQVAIMRRAYRLLDAEQRLVHDHCPGEHHFDGTHLQDNLSALERI